VPAKCAKCGKTAYATEQVKSGKFVFHSKCFKCWSCEVSIARVRENAFSSAGGLYLASSLIAFSFFFFYFFLFCSMAGPPVNATAMV
jgi:hypothetical protein